jgi:glycosyltransferase involved in cell wall biosynthesis
MRNFIFWQGLLSIHQSAFLRCLAKHRGVKVTLVVPEELDVRRRESGWYKPNFGNTRVIVRPTQEMLSKLLTEDLSDSAFIFSGTKGGGPMVWNTFLKSLSSNVFIGIYSEAYNDAGIKGLARFWRSKYEALRFRERVNVILGIGTKGADWFRKSGYLPNRIFPFGYFVETPSEIEMTYCKEYFSDHLFNIIFVGRPLYSKGLDVLLSALHGLSDRKWLLHVVGDGDDKDEYVRRCAAMGLTHSVRFYNSQRNLETLSLISKSDLLVLPSRWDGWGAVVNEALMLGVPVVCSDRCGAADLLDGNERGEVFAGESILGLRAILERRLSKGKKDAGARQKIRDWSKCINGEAAAEYFLEIISASIAGSDKPVAPWSKWRAAE